MSGSGVSGRGRDIGIDHGMDIGLGLKPVHVEAALACHAEGLWYEVHPENYRVPGGPRLAWLQAIGERHPLSLHGVSLSIAGREPLDADDLRAFRALIDRVRPVLVSEHLAWCRASGRVLPDLLPILRTGEALVRIAGRIDAVQAALGRRIAIENPSHYLPLAGHDWDEVDFLAELVRRSGCGLLLDLNNVHVSANNLGTDATAIVDRFPAGAVMEIHLAGHRADEAHPALLIDSHDAAVAAPVWDLYERFVRRAGPRPTLIERDDNLPSFAELLAERDLARQHQRNAIGDRMAA